MQIILGSTEKKEFWIKIWIEIEIQINPIWFESYIIQNKYNVRFFFNMKIACIIHELQKITYEKKFGMQM